MTTCSKWEAKARLAQVLRPDLWEGVTAYLHFLHGNGADLAFDYEEYVEDDRAGQRTLQSVVEDVQLAAFELHRALGGGPRNFLMQSEVIRAGAFKNDGKILNGRYPYAGTESWQKAIGAHFLWVEAEVSARDEADKVVVDVVMTLMVEDMYNFNPGNEDIATGILDDENGRFELVGLGHEFLSKATLVRHVHIEANRDGVSIAETLQKVEVRRP
jgi:hypothetical protein